MVILKKLAYAPLVRWAILRQVWPNQAAFTVKKYVPIIKAYWYVFLWYANCIRRPCPIAALPVGLYVLHVARPPRLTAG